MKNRLYLVGGVLLVAALGWGGWQAARALRCPSAEPVYNGESLSYWLTNAGLPVTEFETPSFLSDSNAVPFLIKAFRADSWIGAAIYRKQVWPRLPASAQRHLPPPYTNLVVRFRATYWLAYLGPVARPAIPLLVNNLREEDDLGIRCQAAFALGRIGKGDSAATSALLEALRDKDAKVRGSAVTALGQIGQANESVFAAMIRALQDKDERVRISAASALARIGKGDSNVVTALVQALRDKDSHVRRSAASALGQLGQANEYAITELAGALTDEDGGVRLFSALALGQAGRGSESAAVALKQASQEGKDFYVRKGAAWALENLGKDGTQFGHYLENLGRMGDGINVKMMAARSLGNLGAEAGAAEALGDLGKANAVVRTALSDTLSDTNQSVRVQATNALLKIDRAPGAKAGAKGP